MDSPVHQQASRPSPGAEAHHSSRESVKEAGGASGEGSVPPSEPRSAPPSEAGEGGGLHTSLTGSLTTGSAHTLEGTQTFNNQAFDGVSVSESEQVTDVSIVFNVVLVCYLCRQLTILFHTFNILIILKNPVTAQLQIQLIY